MSDRSQLKLSQLTAVISAAMGDVFAGLTFWVIADITDHKYYPEKGHHYFSLVEKDPSQNRIVAKIAGVAWQQGSGRISSFEKVTGQLFHNDINVLVNVSVDYHPVYGLKVTLLDIDTNFTIGLLEKQRLETIARLLDEFPEFIRRSGECFLTLNNQLEMKPVIQRIAVITSLNSAGFQDFQHTLANNTFHYHFKVDSYYAAVQGIENARDIRQRFQDVLESGVAYDAVVLIRGGGSQTDFLIFDTFTLGEIVARFPVPVITGIGHQKNETIVDLMAHTPLKTPTMAAEFIIAHNRRFEEALNNLQKTIIIESQQLFSSGSQQLSYLNNIIVNSTRDRISRQKENLARLNQGIISRPREILMQLSAQLMMTSGQLISRPGVVLANRMKDLRVEIASLAGYTRKYLVNTSSYLEHFRSLIRLMSPESIMKKGFSIVYHKGKIITDPGKIGVGDDITVVFPTTELVTNVKEKKKRNGREFNL